MRKNKSIHAQHDLKYIEKREQGKPIKGEKKLQEIKHDNFL